MLLAVGILWTATPLAEYVDAERLRNAAEQIRRHDWAPAVVLLVYLGASPTFFPITLLNVIIAVVFAPAQAFVLSLTGSMLNAALSFGLGRLLGRRWLRHRIGPRLARLSRRLGRGGIPVVVGMMVTPLGPYTFVNMVCGASHIRALQHQAGVVLGLAPTLALLVVMGDGLWRLIDEPTPVNLTILTGIVLLWTAGGFGLQYLLDRRPGSRRALVRQRVADRRRHQRPGGPTSL
jgi:phospholipase D1/2